ncbi:MAG: 1-acyl-sn-glycerol-3-phosphate acyltransferase [Proteobacteria bacterium]|nr:1-acyl-sn-glycerol-3-phosphate acyltransferase [Pseudomonadota bacterium]
MDDPKEKSEMAWAAVDRFDPEPTRSRQAAAQAVAAMSRLIMKRLNNVQVLGAERLETARSLQRPGAGLLTYSNHVSLFDDPLLLACFSGPEWKSLRWVAADALNFFGTPAKAMVFNAGKAVPIIRGEGVDQPGMHFLAERLQAGEWVHVFPEGGRSRRAEGRLKLPLKSGLAHLIQHARPLLLAFHHVGMHEVLPIGSALPRRGKTVTVRFGEVEQSATALADMPVEDIMAHATERLLALEASQRS